MNKVLELGQFEALQLPTEHFFVVSGEATIKTVLERMRDEACPVAVFVQDGKVSGTLTADVVLEKVVGQPGVWDQPASSIAVSTPAVSAGTKATDVHKQLARTGYVVVSDAQGPVRVVSKVTWMRFLNQNFNTMIFNQGPESERATRSKAHV